MGYIKIEENKEATSKRLPIKIKNVQGITSNEIASLTVEIITPSS
jgi:hypothetical protein